LTLIFDKFYQSRNQNIRKPLGSGLGLAICKKIMQAHKGSISAKNMEIGVEFEIKMNFKNSESEGFNLNSRR
jgi:signal transduction histidine kinase